METVADYFGSLVFNDAVMREKLPKDIYKTLRQTVSEGRDIDLAVANSVANAMKVWALEHGCTHYTHWFQPMTGITAEKHEAFVGLSVHFALQNSDYYTLFKPFCSK